MQASRMRGSVNGNEQAKNRNHTQTSYARYTNHIRSCFRPGGISLSSRHQSLKGQQNIPAPITLRQLLEAIRGRIGRLGIRLRLDCRLIFSGVSRHDNGECPARQNAYRVGTEVHPGMPTGGSWLSRRKTCWGIRRGRQTSA